MADIKTMPRCVINAIYIHRTEFRFVPDFLMKSRQSLEIAYNDLVDWIMKIEIAEETDHFPRNTHHCEDYGGCPYRALRDVVDKKFYDKIVAANFVVGNDSHDSGADPNKRYYSYSKISTFMECPRKYMHRYVDRIYPRSKSTALSAGFTIACGLDVFRKTGSLDQTLRAMADVAKNSEEVELFATKAQDPLRSLERLMEIMAAYIKTHQDEPSKIIKPEVTFEVPIDKEEVRIFRGRIDGVIMLQNNRPGIIEDKTTTRLGEYFFKYHKAAPQISWYLWAANQLGLFTI